MEGERRGSEKSVAWPSATQLEAQHTCNGPSEPNTATSLRPSGLGRLCSLQPPPEPLQCGVPRIPGNFYETPTGGQTIFHTQIRSLAEEDGSVYRHGHLKGWR